MLTPEEQERAVKEFIDRHAKPYDPTTDDYDRPPFAADIKEGKNDPVYNAHSYHTKVPPRGIIPYVLHYTKPGDLILDPFCGSGMTGVAAMMCADPPSDIISQFSDLKDNVGERVCILNDLSPAASHIAYNYSTPLDVTALKHEFERIRIAVKDEFNWLYSTEHYEPAVGPHDPKFAEVAARLKNPPSNSPKLITAVERTWELITRAEVEKRLGYSVTQLPRRKEWSDLDVSNVQQWVAIPATIMYTIWSDVYRCEGLVTVEEPTGKVSKRGKNIGKPIVTKKRVPRGCGADIVIWEAAITADGEVVDIFKCPYCSAVWKKWQLQRQRTVAVVTNLAAEGMKHTRKGMEPCRIRYERRVSFCELSLLHEVESKTNPYWTPDTEMDTQGPRYRRDALQVRKIRKVTDFWTPRNLWAFASLWNKVQLVVDRRIRDALSFALTAITYYITKKQAWGTGGGGLSGQLFISSFPLEKHVFVVWERKVEQLITGFASAGYCHGAGVLVLNGSATNLPLPDQCIDYVFTDPPFGSNIYYSEPNLLWEAWLGRLTNTREEAVVHRKNDGGSKRIGDYARLMEAAFCELFRVLKPGRWCTVEFNNSDGSVFEVIKDAIRASGFEIVNMLLFDKTQKTFQQVKGAGLGVVDKDVFFNLHKPATPRAAGRPEDSDVERQIVDAVRQHLHTLPDRIKASPAKYSDDHRTTATINSMLMNSLIPQGISVQQLNLPLIERVCGRYFRKVGQRWYLRGEAIGNGSNENTLVEEEIVILDEVTAIAWLRQQVKKRPSLIGELKPLWMRATGLLSAEVSRDLVLEDLLMENFWRDADSNRWREPTDEEREQMNDDRSIRVLHDAERFVDDQLKHRTTDAERCEWINVLFQACRACDDNEKDSVPALRGFEPDEGYRLISRLFHSILREKVPCDAYSRAEKQARVASQRISKQMDVEAATAEARRKRRGGPTLFDGLDNE